MRKPDGKKAAMWLLMIPLGFGFSLFLNLLLHILGFRSDAKTEETLLGYFGGNVWILVLIVVILAPLLEEFLFRKLLYGALKRKLKPVVAMLITSVAFAVLHIDPVQMIYAFLFGLLLAEITERSGNYLMGALAHMTANLTAVLMNIWPEANRFAEGNKIPLMLGGVIILTLSVFLFERLARKRV